MTQPLALVFYERLLSGSQLVNRLQDLGYRVQTVPAAGLLGSTALESGALLVCADLQAAKCDVCATILQLKQNDATRHLPVIAFADEQHADLQAAARVVGAIVVSDTMLLAHLPQLLDQALQLD
jgi:CheY-like chemotaxis protein